MNAIGRSTWSGTWRLGNGHISSQSGTLLQVPYSYQSRFVAENGASPEELLAAGHASCFNQALANNLDKASLVATQIDTAVSVDYGLISGQPTISGSHISVAARVPGASAQQFEEIAGASARGCTISRILSCPITFTAVLTD
jgi:osmotically inducible protein OsmC